MNIFAFVSQVSIGSKADYSFQNQFSDEILDCNGSFIIQHTPNLLKFL